jgi:hypothetical protein
VPNDDTSASCSRPNDLKRGFYDLRRRGVAQGMVERLRRMQDRGIRGKAMLCDHAHWPALSE